MRRTLALVGSLIALAPVANAQGIQDAALITAPMFTQFTFGSGVGERKISQMAIPFALVIPFTERFSVDISTAFANSEVTASDSVTSSISGLTDTQIRANFSVGGQLVFTMGVNIPTGQYSVPVDQREAAGQIGNDFLNYPISSMGNGFAGTGGIAYARPVGEWNLGFGASMRKSSEFSAFERESADDFRFTPADEYRGRISANRPIGDGQVSLGLTYSVFGEDFADSSSYSTGDRFIASGGWSFPYKGADVYLSAWNLYRLEGQQQGADAPKENVFNVNAAVSVPIGKLVLQPSTELRLWQIGGARAGNLVNLGARLRVGAGVFALFPQVGYSIGTLYSTVDGSPTAVSGFRAGLTIRYN